MKGQTQRFRFEGQEPDQFPRWVWFLNIGAIPGESGRLVVTGWLERLVLRVGDVLVRNPAGVMWVERKETV